MRWKPIVLIIGAILLATDSLRPDTRIAYTSESTGNGDIYVMNADGSNQVRLTDDPAYDAGPAWSPDGARIAFVSTRSGNADIYVMDADGGNIEQLTFHESMDFWPQWSPDGMRIVFASWRDGQGEIYVMNPDGSDRLRLTNTPGSSEDFPAWSPDGTQIVFSRIGDGAGTYIMDSDGSNVQSLTGFISLEPAWSPDGGRIAFGSDHEGFRAIYVIDVDGTDLERLSNAYYGENGPDWSSDGTKIAFASWGDGDGEIYVMNADGSQHQRLTSNGSHDEFPAWEPSDPIDIPCCSGRVGDANGSGGDEPTIGDVSVLIDVLFITGNWDILSCLTEADVNRSGGSDPQPEDITIGDISVLIDYLFITGSSLGLAECPPATGAVLEIPNGTAVLIDGTVEAGEWDDAVTVEFLVGDQAVITAGIKHDGAALLVVYHYRFEQEENLCFPELLIDVANDKSADWTSNDWWFHVSGTDCEAHGTYDVWNDCSVIQSDWEGVPNFSMVPDPPPLDTFEIRIPFIKLGVVAGDTIGLAFRAEYVPYGYAYWPSPATAESPSTWATAVLEP